MVMGELWRPMQVMNVLLRAQERGKAEDLASAGAGSHLWKPVCYSRNNRA